MSKPIKAPKNFHTANTKHGMGDSYGPGVKNPTAIPRVVMKTKVSGKVPGLKKGSGPRSLA